MSSEHAFPDLHHKMSKKIAQLTKVIYFLNTKNDDNEFKIKHLVGHYDNEIEEIVREASEKIANFRDMFEKQNKKESVSELLQVKKKKIQQIYRYIYSQNSNPFQSNT